MNHSEEYKANISDNDAPIFLGDYSDAEAYTGAPFHFIVEIQENVGIQELDVWIWMEDQSPVSIRMEDRESIDQWSSRYRYILDVPESGPRWFLYAFMISDENGTRMIQRMFKSHRRQSSTHIISDLTADHGVKGESVVFAAVAEDNRGIRGVYIRYWTTPELVVNSSMVKDGPQWTLEVLAPRHTNGSMYYILSTVDTSGNWCSTVVRTIALVNPPPIIDELPIWVMTEEIESTLDLGPYIHDRTILQATSQSRSIRP